MVAKKKSKKTTKKKTLKNKLVGRSALTKAAGGTEEATPTKKYNKKKKKKKKSMKKPTGTCFVLMPFREPFNTYYNSIIEPAVTKANLQPKRGDSLFLPTPIMADIWAMIQNTKVLVAVLTGKNANVFYELGLGHAIGKPIVLVSETMDDVPFDLQALRVILYNKDDPRWGDKLRNAITAALNATISEPVDAVPAMFRKKVKSQAPEDSELSLRLATLERQVKSLRPQQARGESAYMRSGVLDPDDARHFLAEYVHMGLQPGEILDKLTSRGVPEKWVIRAIKDYMGR